MVYASATDVLAGRMFLAGVILGLLAGTMLMVTIYVIAKIRNFPKGEWLGWQEVFASGLDAIWGLFFIVIILWGIYGGPPRRWQLLRCTRFWLPPLSTEI